MSKKEKQETTEKKTRIRRSKADAITAKIEKAFAGKVPDADLQKELDKVKAIIEGLQEKAKENKKGQKSIARITKGKSKKELQDMIALMQAQLQEM